MNSSSHSQGVVLALGGGGAKGLAHIGVLQVLEEQGIAVRAVAGTSVGAEVGAFLAIGMPIAEIVSLATSFDWKQTLQLFMPDLPTGGLASGKNIIAFLNNGFRGERFIEDLTMGYVAVAADLETGQQVVLDRGSLIDAVRASLSMPAMLAPYSLGGRLLVDGGVVNPVPFDVARSYFGGPVLAVAVNAGALSFRPHKAQATLSRLWPTRGRQLLEQPWMKQAEPLRLWLQGQFGDRHTHKKPGWGARQVLDRAMDITVAQLMHTRMKLHAPELLLIPDVRHIGPLEFYRGKEAIAAGREAAMASLPDIHALLTRQDI